MESVVCNTSPHRTPTHIASAARLLCRAVGFVPRATPARSAELAQTIERIKPPVIGIGAFLMLSVLCAALLG